MRVEYLVLSLLALAAHFIFGLTIWVFVAIFSIWLLVALFVTTVLVFVTSGTYAKDERPNKNPYSAKTDEYEPKK